MISLLTYEGTPTLPFGSSEATSVEHLGPPLSRRGNRLDQVEYIYPGFIVRFDAAPAGLREITVLPKHEATLNGTRVGWTPDFLIWLQDQDHSLQEAFGYVVSYKLGLAVTGFHDDDLPGQAIHLFRRGDYDKFLPNMKPFRWP